MHLHSSLNNLENISVDVSFDTMQGPVLGNILISNNNGSRAFPKQIECIEMLTCEFIFLIKDKKTGLVLYWCIL